MANDPALAELASSLSVEDTPVKLRCATCSRIAFNALRLPCCDQNICETCYNELDDICQVCHHEPLDRSLCTPNKSLRTTTKVFLKRKLLERAKEQKKAEDAATAPAAAEKEKNEPTQALDAAASPPLVANQASTGVPPANDQPGELPIGEQAGDVSKEEENAAQPQDGAPGDLGIDGDAKAEMDNGGRDIPGPDGTQNPGMDFQGGNGMAGMNGINPSFPMDMNAMMAMGGMPNMMGMGMDPMMMNAMANSMFGGFGGPNMGMNGIHGMGMGQFGGPWMNGQDSFDTESQGNVNFANGGYNMPSHQGNFNQQYSHNDYQSGFGRRGGFYPRGRGRRGGFYGGQGRFQQGMMNQGHQNGYIHGNVAGGQPSQQQYGLDSNAGQGRQDGDNMATGEDIHEDGNANQNDLSAAADGSTDAVRTNAPVSGDDPKEASGEGISLANERTIDEERDEQPHGDASAEESKPLPIQTFISDEPHPRVVDPPGPNVPRGPASRYPASRGFRGPAGAASSVAQAPAVPIEPKAVGVPGAPTGPRALRVGLPNTGRSGIEISRRANAAPAQPRLPEPSPSPRKESRRSRSRSPSQSRPREHRHEVPQQRSRSRSRGDSPGDRREKDNDRHDDRDRRDDRDRYDGRDRYEDQDRHHQRSHEAERDEERDGQRSSNRRRRSSERDGESPGHRRRRERSYDREVQNETARDRNEDRDHHDYDRDRKRYNNREPARDSERHRRRRRTYSRSRSPTYRSAGPTPTSAKGPTFPPSDEGSRKRRERDLDDEDDHRRSRDHGRRRKRSRRDRSASYERGARHAVASSREVSKPSTPITPGFPSVQRRESGVGDDGFRPPSGPSSKAIPTGPRADSSRADRDNGSRRSRHRRNSNAPENAANGPGRVAEKNPHEIEREARNRERLIKELQRRATVDGPKKRGSEPRRKGNVRYEDENGEDTGRGRREREGNRWK